jgi:hypothetical protein
MVLFLTTATATESAAVYLLLAGLSLTLGFALGVVIAAFLLIYRRRWLSKLRDRLASDGITANEVVWFRSELTSAERASLAEIERSNPLLADAYLETLANRLTASALFRVLSGKCCGLNGRSTGLERCDAGIGFVQKELAADHEKLEHLRQQANDHLVKAKTRLQTIEATARRI